MKIYYFEIEEGADAGYQFFTNKRKAESEQARHMREEMEPSKIFESDAIELLEEMQDQILNFEFDGSSSQF